MSSKFYLMLVVLGLTAVIRTSATALDGRQDDAYQQELTGVGDTNNQLDGPSQESQFPFYYNNKFDCTKHQYTYGMYADMDFQCQVYHVCHNNRKETFLCPQGTLFNQRLLVCDHWYSVNCHDTPSFYYANEELGKLSNKTRFDSRDRPYSHRRFPVDYGQHSPHSPSYTTAWQGQQFSSSYDRNTQLPFSLSTTAAPVDSYRTPDQISYPFRSQSGRRDPQTPRDQISNYGQPQIGSQLGQQDRQVPGYSYYGSRSNVEGPQYGNRQQNFNYAQQKPETDSRDSLRNNQQSQFNQPSIDSPGTQQNRGLIFTHYSQSGVRRPSQGTRANSTWPFDRNEQRNSTEGFQYSRHPPSSWRYGQNYPENTLLGTRYNSQKPSTSQYGQQLPDKITPGIYYRRHQSAVSQDGELRSQILTSGLTYDNQQPSAIPPAQISPLGRAPGSLYGHHQATDLESGQKKPEFGTSDFLNGRHDLAATQRGQQLPQSGSTEPPRTSHHPFITRDGNIHSQAIIPGSIYSQQHPSQYSQQPTHSQVPGSEYNQQQPPFAPHYGQQQPSFVSQYGQQQPHVRTSGTIYGKQPSSLHGLTSGRHDQPIIQYRQNQSYTTNFGPPHSQQQPINLGSRPRHSEIGTSIGTYSHQQLSTTHIGQGLQSGVQRNRSQLYEPQIPVSRFQVYQPQITRKLEFGYSSQSLNRQTDHKPESRYDSEQNTTSDYEEKKQDSEYSRHNHPTSFDREPKVLQQGPHWQQPWNSEANTQGYKYSWQKPGSPRYSFQQPQYRNTYSSRNPVSSSQLTPSSSNDSSPAFSGSSDRFNVRDSWNLRDNNTATVPTETQIRSVSKESQDKNLKPILVYQ